MAKIEIDKKAFKKYMDKCAEDFTIALRERLKKNDTLFTGAGISELKARFDQGRMKLTVDVKDYLKYIEYGHPHPVMGEELIEWVIEKYDFITDEQKSNDKIVRQIAENIAQKISTKGPIPQPFFRPSFSQDLPKIMEKNKHLLTDINIKDINMSIGNEGVTL